MLGQGDAVGNDGAHSEFGDQRSVGLRVRSRRLSCDVCTSSGATYPRVRSGKGRVHHRQRTTHTHSGPSKMCQEPTYGGQTFPRSPPSGKHNKSPQMSRSGTRVNPSEHQRIWYLRALRELSSSRFIGRCIAPIGSRWCLCAARRAQLLSQVCLEFFQAVVNMRPAATQPVHLCWRTP